MATVGRLTLNQLIANSDIQVNQAYVASDLQVGGPAVFSDIVYLDGGANSDLVSGLNAYMFDGAQLDTDVTLAGDTDVSVPTEHAVKTYADTLVAGATVVHTSGDETIAGTKTFSSDIAGVIPAVRDQGTGAGALKCKVIAIGDWNMDTTRTKQVSHGLTKSTIRSVTGILYSDDGGYETAIPQSVVSGGTGAIIGTVSVLVGDTDINLIRDDAGYFDGVGFNATSFNRGYLAIWYDT